MKTCYPSNWIKFFKAVCDEHRQMILQILKKNKRLNASQIIDKMSLSQPTVSHHLKILKDAQIINSKKTGKEVYYSLNIKNISGCCLGFMKIFSS